MGKEVEIYKDWKGKEVSKGDVIDLNQTVNGYNIFVVLSLYPLDIRYAYDLTRVYEYDMKDLFSPCKYSGETDIRIVCNIYDLIRNATTSGI